jgi:hypothetical protein
MPGVVLAARNSHGDVVTDAKVSMDGVPLVDKLDGTAIEIDPGPHIFRFLGRDGTTVERSFAVLEGQKTQEVDVTLEAANSRHVADAPAVFWTTRRKIGVASAGVGAAGVVLGSVFGVVASSAASQQSSDCSTSSACISHSAAASEHSTAAMAADVSTVGFIAGGALLAAGAILFLTGGPSHAREATALSLSPEGIPHGGELLLRRRF